MNIRIVSLISGTALMAGIGFANAEEALQLTEKQMDHITAGSAVGTIIPVDQIALSALVRDRAIDHVPDYDVPPVQKVPSDAKGLRP